MKEFKKKKVGKFVNRHVKYQREVITDRKLISVQRGGEGDATDGIQLYHSQSQNN
jgi:hypothetical protein